MVHLLRWARGTVCRQPSPASPLTERIGWQRRFSAPLPPGYSRAMEHVLSREDAELVAGLRARDEAAFAALMRMYGAGMLRVARMHVSSRAVAEEVVQEAWLAVLKGIDRFEGRSSVKTWLFRIVANTAKTRGVREARSAPFSSFADDEATVSPDRFLGADERFPGHWAVPPASWAGVPEERLLATETMDVIRRTIER